MRQRTVPAPVAVAGQLGPLVVVARLAPWIASTELAQALADRISQELEATFSEKYLEEILDELGKK